MVNFIDTPLTRAHMEALRLNQLPSDAMQRPGRGVDFDLPSDQGQSLASILGMFGKSAPQQGAINAPEVFPGVQGISQPGAGEVFPGVQNIDPQSGTGRPEGVGGTFGSGGFLDRFLSGGQNTGTIAGAFQSGLMGGDQFRAQRASQRALSEKVADLKLRQLEAETKALERPADRKIIKDVRGVNRFLDTGEQVFEGTSPKSEGPGPLVEVQTPQGVRLMRRSDAEGRVPAPSQQEIRTGPLTSTREDDLRAQFDANDAALGQIDFAIDQITSDPSRAGIVGTGRRALQFIVGATKDIASATGLEFARDAKQGLADSGISEFFDSALPQIDIIENQLAYAVARSRKPTGKLNSDDIKNAKGDIKLKGVTDSSTALERLRFLKGIIGENQSSLGARLSTDGGDASSIPKYRFENGVLVRAE